MRHLSAAKPLRPWAETRSYTEESQRDAIVSFKTSAPYGGRFAGGVRTTSVASDVTAAIQESFMGRSSEGELISQRFHIGPPPLLVVESLSRHPLTFARLRSGGNAAGLTSAVPAEEAFAFQVLLAALPPTECWVDGKRIQVPRSPPGSTFLFDLTRNPITRLDEPFDTIRFYISRLTLEKMSHENGGGNVRELSARSFGGIDPIMHGLARSIASAMEEETSDLALFGEFMALAFHVHVARLYGSSDSNGSGESPQGGLAPWQLRRSRDMMLANLNEQSSITAMAAECRISPSHFARAFKRTTGLAPHQWLVQRRMEAAKELLMHPAMKLCDVAQACGFVDQSHLTAVFGRQEGLSPGKWRRQRRL